MQTFVASELFGCSVPFADGRSLGKQTLRTSEFTGLARLAATGPVE